MFVGIKVGRLIFSDRFNRFYLDTLIFDFFDLLNHIKQKNSTPR